MSENSKVPQSAWYVGLYLWTCERLYHELAWLYDVVSWAVSAGQWRKWQGSVWQYVTGKRILDLGCGTGAMLVQGEELGYRMVGLDRSPEMLAVAAHRLAKKRSAASLQLSDGHQFPIANCSFDSVIATFPAGYILDHSTLSEIRRVLRPEGKVVIAGLWVAAHFGLEKYVPIFYGRPSADVMEAMAGRVRNAGFVVRWYEVRKGRFSVGVLVADKNDA